MRLDDYVMTERDKCRLAATLSTPEGRERLEKSLDEAYKTLHWLYPERRFCPPSGGCSRLSAMAGKASGTLHESASAEINPE